MKRRMILGTLMALLTVAMAGLHFREIQEPQRLPWSALAAFLLCITRPEGVLYAATLGLVKLAHAGARREHVKQVLRYAGGLGAALLVYHAWHYAVFGEFVPNTFYAKPHIDDASSAAWSYIKQAA